MPSILTHMATTEKPLLLPSSTTGGGRYGKQKLINNYVITVTVQRKTVAKKNCKHSFVSCPFPISQVNMVFDNLRATQDYNGYVFFLEEDHYVAPDFLQVAHQLIRLKEQKCSNCDFINLGMYNKAKVLNNRVSTVYMYIYG